jgi:hypothetical protein
VLSLDARLGTVLEKAGQALVFETQDHALS